MTVELSGQRWALLQNVEDWDLYRGMTAKRHNVHAHLVQWGKGPLQYPCLVASLWVQSDNKFAGCYVYVDDAMRLCAAASASFMGLPLAAAAPPPPPVPSLPTDIRDTFDNIKIMLERITQLHASSRENHNHVAANLLAIVKYLVDTGICRSEQYEATFASFLAFVDQHGVDKGAQIALDAKSILATLYPDRV